MGEHIDFRAAEHRSDTTLVPPELPDLPIRPVLGEIGERLDMPASTLAHHLKFLTAAGIVAQQKVGRSTINQACLDELAELGQYIMAECCQDQLTSHQHRAANDG